MMDLKDMEEKQNELLKKVQALFVDENRTQKDMENLMDEIQKFEKERTSLLINEVFGENDKAN
jgi:hypothetical protein